MMTPAAATGCTSSISPDASVLLPSAQRRDGSARCALARAAAGEGDVAGVVDPAARDPAAARSHPAAQDPGRGQASLGAAAPRLPSSRGLAVREVATADAGGHAL